MRNKISESTSHMDDPGSKQLLKINSQSPQSIFSQEINKEKHIRPNTTAGFNWLDSKLKK
jgi:hypothetical protein